MYEVFLQSFLLLTLIVNSTATFLMDDERFTEVHIQNGFTNFAAQRCYKLFTVLAHPHTKFRDMKAAKFSPFCISIAISAPLQLRETDEIYTDFS